ncbi:MAG: bifunctional chorismate mutase/prephenate dehydratase [Candidatus Avilachnospira sp.]|jgi:chorismate mutase/prephenate dehydratase
MDISDARREIDKIDVELTELFVKRMKLSKEIAAYKKDNNLPVFDKTREREIINKAADRAGKDMENYISVLYTTLFDVSRSYQKQLIGGKTELTGEIEKAFEETEEIFPARSVVACQGVEGAYSQYACDKLFSMPSIMYFNRFQGVFQAVESGLCKYGILPIENSTAGSVNEVYDLMRKHRFYIVRSIKLRIDHNLLVKEGTKLGDIKEIISHQQALDQCSEFLKTLKDVKITVCENTAAAAKAVAESGRNDIAAISSKNCADLYGLHVLSDTIQNNDNNYTRFICISKKLEIYPGADKISMMFSIAHKPGALYNVISRFSSLGLNLTKLESRPMPGKDFEFMFYFDLNANIREPKVLKLIGEFDDEFDKFTFLGSYSEII